MIRQLAEHLSICIAAFDDALGGAPSLAGLGSIPPAQRDAAPDALLPAGASGARNAPGDAKSNVEITPVEVRIARRCFVPKLVGNLCCHASRSGAARSVAVVAQVDPSVTFDQVGGLDGYIDKLKEMIFLPLVYPELFERFHVNPPRGVLLYGPPGKSRYTIRRWPKPPHCKTLKLCGVGCSMAPSLSCHSACLMAADIHQQSMLSCRLQAPARRWSRGRWRRRRAGRGAR
jgi:hypothetical protein